MSMERFFVLFALLHLGQQLYAQDTLMAQKTANEIGTAIVCDSLGRPYGKLDIFDSEFDVCFVGAVFVDVFTKQDMIHIDSVRIQADILRKNDNGVGYDKLPRDAECYSALCSYVQDRVQNDLKGGFLVYPERGLLSEHISRTFFLVRFQINVSPDHMNSWNTE